MAMSDKLHLAVTQVIVCLLSCSKFASSQFYACPPSGEYVLHKYTCYKFVYSAESAASYQDASKTCREQIGNLVNIHDDTEAEFLSKAVQKFTPANGSWWIGLYYDNAERIWKWDTDIPSKQDTSYVYSNYINKDSAFFMPDQYGVSFVNSIDDCLPTYMGKILSYICEMPAVPIDDAVYRPVEPTTVKPCPEKYDVFGSYCYFVGHEQVDNVTYRESRNKCMSQGAAMLSLQSESEAQFVSSKTSVYGSKSWWLGLKYNYTSEKWQWDTPFPEDRGELKYNKIQELQEGARLIPYVGSFTETATAWKPAHPSYHPRNYICKKPVGDVAMSVSTESVSTTTMMPGIGGSSTTIAKATSTKAATTTVRMIPKTYTQPPSSCLGSPCPDNTACIPVNDTVYLCVCNDEFMTGKHCEHLDTVSVCRRNPPCSGYPFMYCRNPFIEISECFCEEHVWFLRRVTYNIDKNCGLIYTDDGNQDKNFLEYVLKYLAPLIGVYTGVVAVAATMLACLTAYGEKKIELLQWNQVHMQNIKPPSFLRWLKAEFANKLCTKEKTSTIRFHPQTDDEVHAMQISEWTFSAFKTDNPDRALLPSRNKPETGGSM